MFPQLSPDAGAKNLAGLTKIPKYAVWRTIRPDMIPSSIPAANPTRRHAMSATAVTVSGGALVLIGVGLIAAAVSNGRLLLRYVFQRAEGDPKPYKVHTKVILVVMGVLCIAVSLPAWLGSFKSPVAAAPPTTSVTPAGSSTPPSPMSTSSTVIPGPGISGVAPSVDGVTKAYLGDLPPVDGRSNYGSSNAATMNGVPYDHSARMACLPAESKSFVTWDVAGYSNINLTVGISDDATGTTGAVADVSFSDQDGNILPEKATVSVGHPQLMSFSIHSLVRVSINCISRDTANAAQPRDFEITLGDAFIS
jgi:hypothetical protein